MKHTAKTAGILVAILVGIIVLFSLAALLEEIEQILITVNPQNWAFFLAGIIVTLIASLIASGISGRFFKGRKSQVVVVDADILD